MRLAALLVLVRDLGEASGDTGALQRCCQAAASIEASIAPAWRYRFEAQRAAFEHGLQLIDAAIPLSQTLGSAEAVSGAIAHAKLFEAQPAAWRIVDQPQLFGPSAALRADEIGPRAAVRELCMSDADEFGLLAEGYEGLLVFKPDRARGPEARYADANEFIKENAAVRVASAFRHELNATPLTCAVSLYHRHIGDQLLCSRAKAGWKSSLDGIQIESGGQRLTRAPLPAADGGRTRERIEQSQSRSESPWFRF